MQATAAVEVEVAPARAGDVPSLPFTFGLTERRARARRGRMSWAIGTGFIQTSRPRAQGPDYSFVRFLTKLFVAPARAGAGFSFQPLAFSL